MAKHNISIQSHTLTHCVLSALDEDDALYELTESRRQISEITGRTVEHVAIPRAGYSRTIRNLVKRVNYKTACCNNKGTANNLSDLLALPRIVIERGISVTDFARCLTPRSSVMLRIIGNIKRVPERIGGPQLAKKVRDLLYSASLRSLFETRSLKMMVAAFAMLYVLGSVLFTWYLMAHWVSFGETP